MTISIKTAIACGLAGLIGSLLPDPSMLGQYTSNTLIHTIPAITFAIAVVAVHWKSYKYGLLTFLGFLVVSVAAYIMALSIASEVGTEYTELPLALKGVPSSFIGLGLTYFAYAVFVEKKKQKDFLIVLGVAMFTGLIFFPLTAILGQWFVSHAIWQAGAGWLIGRLYEEEK